VTEQQEQIDDLKYQLIKLSDKIKQAELAHNNEENTLNEKVRVYKEQIKTL